MNHWRLRLLLSLLLTGLFSACHSKAETKRVEPVASTDEPLEQTLEEAVQIICNAAAESGSAGADPAEQAMLTAKYISQNISHPKAISVFASLAEVSQADKRQVLQQLVEEARVSPCPLVESAAFKPVVPEPEVSSAALAGEEAEIEIPFESHYVGKHKLGVNRVNNGKRTGEGSIVREANALVLQANVKEGEFHLKLSGIVEPVSKTEFVLDGELSGVPNYSRKTPAEQSTKGRFTFRATKGRKFWRLYDVDGKECVCDDNCGNDFCYIDLSF